MRVLITSGVYVLDGSSVVTENLANQLAKMGVQVTIGALRFKRIPLKGNYDIVTIPFHDVRMLKRLFDQFDIVHNNHPIVNYLAPLCCRPFIFHCHGAPNVGMRQYHRLNLLTSIRLMSSAFDSVIAVSESGAEELRRYFSLHNVHVIYDGVDTDHFKEGLEEKFRKGTPQLLFVGNLYPHKNIREIVLATRELVKTFPKIQLQIVGGGFTYEHVRRLIANLQLEDHVSLVGRVYDREELPYYYASCDVYVTASRCEVFGMPLLEAMACGKPVVASSIPSHVEIISKSKAGNIYPLGNIGNMCKIIMNTLGEGDAFRANALSFAQKHNWEAHARQVLEVYAQV